MDAKVWIAAFDSLPLVAIYGIDQDGIVRYWNLASSQLFGIAQEQAMGHYLDDLLHFYEGETGQPLLLPALMQAQAVRSQQDYRVITSLGKEIWVCLNSAACTESNQAAQILCVAIDITQRKHQEHTFQSSIHQFRTFFENSSDAIIIIQNGQFMEFNPAALHLFGYAQELAGLKGVVPYMVSPKLQPDGCSSQEKMEEMQTLACTKGSHRFEWQYYTRDKQIFWGEVTLTVVAANGNTLLYAVVRDITQRKETEQNLQLSAKVFENSHESILILDPDWRIVSANRAFTGMTGFSTQQVVGERAGLLKSTLYDQTYYDVIMEELNLCKFWQGEIWMQRMDGSSFPSWTSLLAVTDHAGCTSNYIAIFSDISERKAAEERIRHLSEHDFLTGLPNRVLLLDRLQQAIATARRNRTNLALLFLDLDRFKNVNDSLGHHVGDKLLQQVAERLTKCVRRNDTVSRQGGDEFIVMLTDANIEQVAHIADHILQTINMPYQIEEYTLSVSTCIGISVYPEDGQDIDALIRNADTAMYHAKESGRNSYQFFNNDMNIRIVQRLSLENQLKRALEQKQFLLQYQPEIDILSGQMVGVEALLRWQHPEAGLLAPEHFLAAAEESGLIVPIGDWVLHTACLQARSWHEQGVPISIGINLSAVQFRQKDLVRKIKEVLQQTGLAAHFLELEINEGILTDASEASMEKMLALRELGVMLAVDDFGTGYSSLSYLKYFPVNKLKIAQCFLRDLSENANDAAVIRAILIMAKSLKLKVIAEGVESVDQLAFLQEQGCDEYQGYYVTHPIFPSELASFMRQSH